ncbi:copper resistance protein B [Sphingomonas sp. CCH18-B1]|uniref:copper resistance protein B n=1 Tax=Sphingomonas sp. CCH18-B1 TaxID=1768744 RepID=UPI00082AD535|nr:copper resistance protein B [Sphingomonas sp. CCH18-B1]
MSVRPVLYAALLCSAVIAAPAVAQHQGRAMPMPAPAPAPSPTPALTTPPADPHAGHIMPGAPITPAPAPTDPHAGHTMPGTPTAPPVDPHAGHAMPAMPASDPADPMADMDHSTMDHGMMDDAVSASPGPDMETPPPPEAGSGPPRAADAIWGADAMRASREDLQRTHGDFPVFWFQGDRFETQVREGADGYLWDLQGYYGGPTSRFWFKSEGEGTFGEQIEDAEVQALYARAIAPFWDLQAGVRQDFGGPDTTHAVIGVQGLSPHQFEVDAALFLSQRGDLTARIEGEVDQRITQRLILQPRAEVNLSAQDIPRLGIGSGIDSVEVGVRLRYEFIREFAPYIGIEQSWRLGGSADYARARGEDPSVTNFLVGIRFWF